ncbi:MAG: hypothetical protein IPM31_15765 [Anaerolineae bacterium]|nr:hypothetical protein [Anaerolineae bacterium]MBL8105863.1 hypothetical protein [Anaerolineales bacterium]MCC7188514.1 hypothetical protein [Anaerolineales bacterium]
MRVFTAAFAIAAGILVLLGYFIDADALSYIGSLITDWAIIIGAFAALIGIINLIFVHMEKFRARQAGGIYSVLLVIALIFTTGFGLLLGPENPFMRLAIDAIIVPVESALMAILVVTLIYASIRLLRRRADLMSVIFLVVAILVLILIMPTPIGQLPGAQQLLDFVNAFSRGGARGLLLGIALGTLLTGLRVLFGIDRPYGGN